MNSISVNGKIIPGYEPALMINNKNYRYGDGLFETMKVAEKKIVLGRYHFERFFSSLETMKFLVPQTLTEETIRQEIGLLCEKNKCEDLARVRLTVFRGNGGLFDSLEELQYTIECSALDKPVGPFNENGLVIDIFPDARKSCDKFSNIKSANYLPYVMAAHHAKQQRLDECLVLNSFGRVADATIANIFLLNDMTLTTPPLSEGCVNGVTRRAIIEKVRIMNTGWMVTEQPVSENDLLQADEVFLTNSISGIRWVRSFRDKSYSNMRTKVFYQEVFQTISE